MHRCKGGKGSPGQDGGRWWRELRTRCGRWEGIRSLCRPPCSPTADPWRYPSPRAATMTWGASQSSSLTSRPRGSASPRTASSRSLSKTCRRTSTPRSSPPSSTPGQRRSCLRRSQASPTSPRLWCAPPGCRASPTSSHSWSSSWRRVPARGGRLSWWRTTGGPSTSPSSLPSSSATGRPSRSTGSSWTAWHWPGASSQGRTARKSTRWMASKGTSACPRPTLATAPSTTWNCWRGCSGGSSCRPGRPRPHLSTSRSPWRRRKAGWG
mmetsp:Transcript_70728/g.223914  ORF Transcript_70728/g.223914 Transcript_70728/m.223914 type:complete len:267 (+) Transcript_70728:265-1065(+)